MLVSVLRRVHRDLHSFPTRRSSDLTDAYFWFIVKRSMAWHASWRSKTQSSITNILKRLVQPSTTDARTQPLVDSPPRSEEHTSELQSRLHLVCRLLLEKKKKETLQN